MAGLQWVIDRKIDILQDCRKSIAHTNRAALLFVVCVSTCTHAWVRVGIYKCVCGCVDVCVFTTMQWHHIYNIKLTSYIKEKKVH